MTVTTATSADAAAIASLRNSAAEDLTRRYGQGHWTSCVTEKSVLRDITTSRVLVVRGDTAMIATLRLATKKPWAIDPTYFTSVRRALYLADMAVEPNSQRQGVGRRLLDEAKTAARAWPSEAIRLDAYDAAAGAGDFYAKCGFREVGRVTYRNTPLRYYEFLL